MKKFNLLFLLIFFYPNFLLSQIIKGFLPSSSNKPIELVGFDGLNTYSISKGFVNEKGHFVLNYKISDFGIGYLISEQNKPFLLILSGEDIELVGKSFQNIETIFITKGSENKALEKFASDQPKREQALSAWSYLEKIYLNDSLFSILDKPKNVILEEKTRIKKEEELFLNNLPKNSYVRWFLPTRKLVSSTSAVAQYRPEEVPATISAFRELDYSENRFYKSGLYKDAIEGHFWLLENSGNSIDATFLEMKKSIDAMLDKLVNDEKKLNEVTEFLFALLEKHSLFQASEYLAVKVLNETSCTINDDLAKQLQTYQAMKKGNTAPDIVFDGENFAPNYAPNNIPKKLSDIKSSYTVVVFGASWCPKCTEEMPEIAKKYITWKNAGVEVVFVSLDEDAEAYRKFVKNFPFINTCDYKNWNSDIVKNYYVFGTPTMYLLNNKREIILRPNSVKQMDAWVDWFLVKGNK